MEQAEVAGEAAVFYSERSCVAPRVLPVLAVSEEHLSQRRLLGSEKPTAEL